MVYRKLAPVYATLVCTTERGPDRVDGHRYGAHLYADGSVHLTCDGDYVGPARYTCTTSDSVTSGGIRCTSVDARIVDVAPFVAWPDVRLQDIATDLTFFARRSAAARAGV